MHLLSNQKKITGYISSQGSYLSSIHHLYSLYTCIYWSCDSIYHATITAASSIKLSGNKVTNSMIVLSSSSP